MNWKKKVFEDFKLYAVTDIQSESRDALKKIEDACRGGIDMIQLRSKTLPDQSLYELGLKIGKMAGHYRKLFFVNDRPDLAILLSADGIHLGQEDLGVSAVRKLAARSGVRLWIGKSTHRLGQALAAVKEGADYIGIGPVFATPTKPDYRPAGLEFIRQASGQVGIPFVAIGGIDDKNIDSVLTAGARRIAVVRAIFGAKNVCLAAQKLREKIENFSG